MTGPRRRTAHDIARGLGAIAVLVVLIAGTPIILWSTGGFPLPEGWPSVGEVWDTIARPDDGSFFLDVLIFAGWVGWAMFTISVLVEIPAVLRGVVAPAVPGLGSQQRFVAGLVAAVAAMLPTTQMAVADTVSMTERSGRLDRSEPTPPVTNDLLDELAQMRASDTKRGGDAEAAQNTAGYRVVPGDTLWDIAETNLGDPRRYTEIFGASTGTVQPDGRRLDDPNVIVPGWRLSIPDATAPEALSPPGGTDPPLSPSDTLPGTGAPDGAGGVAGNDQMESTCLPSSSDPSSSDQETTGDEPAEGVVAPGQASDPGGAGQPGAVTDPPEPSAVDIERTDRGGFVRTGAGIGAVLASGLVAALVARRALRQRRRRTGESLPHDSVAARAMEIQLRHVADPSAVRSIDRVLRSLGSRLAELSQPLPALQIARLHGPVLELSLAATAGLPPPFRDAADGLVWKADIGLSVLHEERGVGDLPAPYPSLVTIGHDDLGGLVLLDLEQCGVLSVSGPSVTVDAVMAAFAAELATSVWADDLRITLIGCPACADLEVLETGRIRRVDDTGHLLDELTIRARDDRALLDQAGVDSLARARSRQLAGATWTPEILLFGTAPSAEQRERLAAIIEPEPRLAIVAVIKELDGGLPAAGWSLRIDVAATPAAVLEPLGVKVRPQLLVDAEYGMFADQLRGWDLGNSDRLDPGPGSGDPRVAAAAATAADLAVTPVGGAPQPTAVSETVASATAERSPTSGTQAQPPPPRLIMLGQVEVADAAELGEPNKLGQLTELAMFIALQPGCDARAIDEAIWPGSVVTKTTRNTAISKLRRWLGTDADAAPWLPRTEGRYTFHSHVRSDWQQWCELIPGSPGEEPTAVLRSALSLVKGRPFSGRGRRKYAWVDRHVQEMIAAIVDVCHELAVRALRDGDPREALRVSLIGLSIEPGVEVMWRDRLKAEVMLGDRATVLESIDKLRDEADELGGDLDEKTESLIEQILRPGPRI